MTKNKIQPALSVAESKQLTANMQRVILTGEQLKDFQLDENALGPHVKLMFPAYEGHVIVAPTFDQEKGKVIWPEGVERPILRTYSVRHFDRAQRQLIIDFARHDGGIASSWAANCKVGDNLVVFGNRAGATHNYDQQWLILLGDLAALPAISYTIENLPSSAQGIALIMVPSKADIVSLNAPAGLAIQWLISDDLTSLILVDALKEVKIPDDIMPLVWGGMETSIARKLRRTILDDLKLAREHFHLVNYWRMGVAEGGFSHRE